MQELARAGQLFHAAVPPGDPLLLLLLLLAEPLHHLALSALLAINNLDALPALHLELQPAVVPAAPGPLQLLRSTHRRALIALRL